MAANRKLESAAVRFGPVIRAALLCLFIAGSGVGYVFQKHLIYTLGQQIKQNELRLEELRRLNKQRGDTLAYLRSPHYLDARVRELNLGLALPSPDQVWRLPLVVTPPAARSAPPRLTQLPARPPAKP